MVAQTSGATTGDRGKTKTGYLWAMARDDRPSHRRCASGATGGADPPGVVFPYIPSRAGTHAERLLTGFDGVLQGEEDQRTFRWKVRPTNGYAGYKRLAKADREGGDPIVLAQCWAHARRKLIDATPKAGSPVAEEALRRIAALYAIEAEIRGRAPEDRRAVRQARSKPLVEALGAWLRAQKDRLSGSSKMGEAVRYILNGWGPLCVQPAYAAPLAPRSGLTPRGRPRRDGLEQGREPDQAPRPDTQECALRRPRRGRARQCLSDHWRSIGSPWARIASLIGTCRMNGVEPYGYTKAVLEAIAAGHPAARIDDLLPWAFARPVEKAAA